MLSSSFLISTLVMFPLILLLIKEATPLIKGVNDDAKVLFPLILLLIKEATCSEAAWPDSLRKLLLLFPLILLLIKEATIGYYS